MAKNTGRGSRKGAVLSRSQMKDPHTAMWVKRNSESGQFLQGKRTGGTFKGVRKEN